MLGYKHTEEALLKMVERYKNKENHPFFLPSNNPYSSYSYPPLLLPCCKQRQKYMGGGGGGRGACFCPPVLT